MKLKLLFVIVCVVCCFACSSVEKEQPIKKYYSERQEKAFAVLTGQFKYYMPPLEQYYTIITFGDHYEVPLEGVNKDGEKVSLHGKMSFTYYEGSKYEYFYWLSHEATSLATYFKSSNLYGDYYIIRDLYDIELVDQNTFKLKEYDTYLWNTYRRQ